MPIYKQTTEITNIDDLFSSVERDIEEVYFGDKNVFTVWGEYEGTLPATLNANGDDMRQYRVYGATGGVGNRTANLFNISSVEKGRIDNGVVGYSSDTTDLSITGNKITFTTKTPYRGICSGFIEILNETESMFFAGSFMGVSGIGKKIVFYDEQKSWLNADVTFSTSVSAAIIAIPNGAKFVRISFTAQVAETARISDFMLTEGTTAPAEYAPNGHGLSLSVTSPKSYTCEVNSLQASTNYAKIAVAELPTVKVGDKVTVTVGGTDYTLPVKNVDSSYVYIENMEV